MNSYVESSIRATTKHYLILQVVKFRCLVANDNDEVVQELANN